MTGHRDERWVDDPTPADDADASFAGLLPSRDLWRMRRPLPIHESFELATRPFEVGRDEDAWLRVNNRAFASHREQGGWTRADLEARFEEPWFDPEGFLLHEEGGELLGFCWTKVHADLDPPEGEIYVIGADPDAQGRGLGRRLTLAGFDHLHRVGGVTIGMLYVDADNTPATRLYESLGLSVVQIRRLYLPAEGGR
jgi:mycothiol synthase